MDGVRNAVETPAGVVSYDISEQDVDHPNRWTHVLVLLRYILKTVVLGYVIKLLGRFFPILLRLLRFWR